MVKSTGGEDTPESVRQQIEKRNRVYATKANKGRKHVVFQPND
jgi:hypothetical protein